MWNILFGSLSHYVFIGLRLPLNCLRISGLQKKAKNLAKKRRKILPSYK